MDKITALCIRLLEASAAFAPHDEAITNALSPEQYAALNDLIEATADLGTEAMLRNKRAIAVLKGEDV